MSDETAWVIERATSPASHPEYLGMWGTYSEYDLSNASGRLAWCDLHNTALRFSRKEDAGKFVGVMRSLSVLLPHGATLPGLRAGDPPPRICEHVWSKP